MAAVTPPRERARSQSRLWVLAQIPLVAGVLDLPLVLALLRRPGPWIPALAWPSRLLGLAGLLVAIATVRAARQALGGRLVANPNPAPNARLAEDGIYARMRHPTYAAMILGTCSWALLWTSLPTLALAAVCAVFFLAKARYEEGLLRTRFPGYDAYRLRVPAIVPRIRSRQTRVR